MIFLVFPAATSLEQNYSPLAKSSIFDPFLPTYHMWSQNAFLQPPITPLLCRNALKPQRCSSSDSSWWTSCLDAQAVPWDEPRSGRGAQRRHEDMHFSLTLLWVPTYCTCPHAPLGSWRWSSEGLVILGMGLREARTGWCLGCPIYHGLSVVLTGSFWHVT